MGLRDAIRTWLTPLPAVTDERASYLSSTFWPFANIGGVTYPLNFQQTLIGPKEEVAGDFSGLVYGGYAGNSVVYACLNARMALFTQARFMYRRLRSGTPGELWSAPELDILRTPWPNGTTGDLLARMIQDADLGGNAFIVRRPGKLARLRPDWVTIVHGSNRATDDPTWDPDAEVIGYSYQPGGPGSGRDPINFQRQQVAHFAPIPDPLYPARGMSWLTPLIREIEGDTAAMTHKLMFFQNGATPNLIITGIVPGSGQSLQDFTDKFRAKNEGVANAYKTLFFTQGVDAKVVGSDLNQANFADVIGKGETRIAAAAGVPPIVAGLSEGLQGSSLNAGNFQAAMRRFADLTGRPLWANACGSLATIISVPNGSELYYDDRFVPALKDDITATAEVQAKQAQAIRQYVDAGFEPDTVVDAINSGDLKKLKHTGLYSVQLQPPMPEKPEPPPPVAVPATKGPANAGPSDSKAGPVAKQLAPLLKEG